MPRKHWRARLSSYDIPANDIDPNVPVPVEDHILVRHALVDFDELGVLSPETKEQLVADLVDCDLLRSRWHKCRQARCVR